MPTPKQLIEKTKELIKKNKLEFIGCEPIINNYGKDKKGELKSIPLTYKL